MNLRQAEIIALAKLDEHGLAAHGWTFRYDRAVKRFGCCKYGPRVITLSRPLVERNETERVLDTILHEIAHALAGPGKGHGSEWKAICRRIGARPVACYSADSTEAVPLRYQATCLHCQHIFHTARAPKGRHACNRDVCRRYPSRDRLLTWIDTTTGRAVNQTISFQFNTDSIALQRAIAAANERSTRTPARRTPRGLQGHNR